MSGGGSVGGESSHRLYEPRNELKILSLNARSLLLKMESLQLLAQAEDLDVICVVETWLSAEILDAEISLCGYQCFRRDRNRHGGGGGGGGGGLWSMLEIVLWQLPLWTTQNWNSLC